MAVHDCNSSIQEVETGELCLHSAWAMVVKPCLNIFFKKVVLFYFLGKYKGKKGKIVTADSNVSTQITDGL
jgi:hypothetical protein